ncbi:MAG TPA: geranylgeranyl reductase family protein [Acidimicrobiales bacterium]|nr:geranylgeranyl reductase family protein [Acidimicrobiales bacterium]
MPPARNQDSVHDVLVVGGGPAGSSCGYWLAENGWDVVVVERKRFPREKTCGDGLTPRSVRQLDDMGLGGALAGSHRYDGLRACAFGKVLEMRWPDHPSFPSYGYVITRKDLDQIVAERAEKAGAQVLQGCEALEPMYASDGPSLGPAGTGSLPRLEGARVTDTATGSAREIRARYVVVADGSNSRFGRALGSARDKGFPMGMALRGYYKSERHDDPYIESHLDLRDQSGAVVPGYGWIFPLGDGRVNVGVGLLTVTGRWKGLNTSNLMDAFVASAPRSWGLSPASSCGPPTGGKLPMGLAVRPTAGPNALVIGDAAGAINPFNGEGIAYGYETGRLAASCLSNALAGTRDSLASDYEERLSDFYGNYYRVGRAFVKLISNPQVLHGCMAAGMAVPPLMNTLLRIMANLMRPDTYAVPETAYRAMARVGQWLPDSTL